MQNKEKILYRYEGITGTRPSAIEHWRHTRKGLKRGLSIKDLPKRLYYRDELNHKIKNGGLYLEEKESFPPGFLQDIDPDKKFDYDVLRLTFTVSRFPQELLATSILYLDAKNNLTARNVVVLRKNKDGSLKVLTRYGIRMLKKERIIKGQIHVMSSSRSYGRFGCPYTITLYEKNNRRRLELKTINKHGKDVTLKTQRII